MIKNYDNVYILKGSLTEEQAFKEIERAKKYFKNVEVYDKENDKNGYLGKKKLAYEIRHETTGYYYLTHFKGNSEDIFEIEKKLRLNDNVLKFITILTEEE